jgi:hypothetical protein
MSLVGTRLRASVALHGSGGRDHLRGASEDHLLSTGRLATGRSDGKGGGAMIDAYAKVVIVYRFRSLTG